MIKTSLTALMFAWMCMLGTQLSAQVGLGSSTEDDKPTKKVRFNGLGRASINQTNLGGAILDTLNGEVDRNTDGEFLLDLAINASPNKVTEVQGILRLRNELGGFFGAGQSIEVRELWARGVIADIIKYRVGDMDMAMTPYTLFNPIEESVLNGAALFQPQRDVIYYEQFYNEPNQRRLQGAKVETGLQFAKVLSSADLTGFISRVRSTDFFNTPNRFVGGGSVNLITQRLKDSFGIQGSVVFNTVHTWDDLTIGEANTGIRNGVQSIGFDFSLFENTSMVLSLDGETGISRLNVLEDSISVSDESDTFLDVGLSLKHKQSGLVAGARFIDVGPDFFSIGAQSKRIDFNRTKTFFNRVGQQGDRRTPSLFDVTRDRALYTFELSDRLMDYDPRLSNVMPYGSATPNRRGVQVNANWGSQNEAIELDLTAAFLSEIRGQGTAELKDFQRYRANGIFNAHKLTGWKNDYRITLGAQVENTSRGGVPVEQIDFSSSLVELGLEAEIYPNLYLLGAGMFLSANGNEYLPVIRSFNEVRDFENPFVIDESESLIGAGLKYDFKKETFITIQFQRFNYENTLNADSNYNLDQIFVLYSMKF